MILTSQKPTKKQDASSASSECLLRRTAPKGPARQTPVAWRHKASPPVPHGQGLQKRSDSPLTLRSARAYSGGRASRASPSIAESVSGQHRLPAALLMCRDHSSWEHHQLGSIICSNCHLTWKEAVPWPSKLSGLGQRLAGKHPCERAFDEAPRRLRLHSPESCKFALRLSDQRPTSYVGQGNLPDC